MEKQLLNGGKVAVSMLLVCHFGAVLLAGFGIGSHTHPAPLPLAYAHYYLCNYLRTLALDTPWQFYAPNPGSYGVLYVHLETGQGRHFWRQWPSNERSPLTEPYVRNFAAASLTATIAPSPDGPDGFVLAPQGEIILGSFARRFAAAAKLDIAAADQVTHVAFVTVTGHPMSPQQARAGWKFGDLRLYHVMAVGSFTATGRRFISLPVRIIQLPQLAFQITQNLRDSDQSADETSPTLPRGIRLLVNDHPEWLGLTEPELRATLRRHFEQH